MAWSTSTRRTRLPKGWEKIRRRVLCRDGGQCRAAMADGSRCTEPATEVDHIVPNDDHDDTNLQSLCTWHHKIKTAGESAAARRRRPRERRGRQAERHPGLL